MKRVIITILLSGYWLLGIAQTHVDEKLLQDSPTTENPVNKISEDPILEEALVDGILNYPVLGKYARDDAFYQQLGKRFNESDTTLRTSDLLILYYGRAYRDEYSGEYAIDTQHELIKKGKYRKAYKKLKASIKKLPASPQLLNSAILAAVKIKRPDKEIERLRWQMAVLLNLIHQTGDGSKEHPITVISVSDEYVFMYEWLDIKRVQGQALVNNDGIMCDQMTVIPGNPEYFNGTEIWFDVTFPYLSIMNTGYWGKKLTSANEEN